MCWGGLGLNTKKTTLFAKGKWGAKYKKTQVSLVQQRRSLFESVSIEMNFRKKKKTTLTIFYRDEHFLFTDLNDERLCSPTVHCTNIHSKTEI